jgi:hypothetical protein
VLILKRKSAILQYFFLLLIMLAIAGCSSSPAPLADDAELPSAARVPQLPPVDGNAEGYPSQPFQVGGVEVYMVHDGTLMQVLVTAEGNGWISVGFNERGRGMDGANMVLGGTDDNGTFLVRNDLGRGWAHSEAVSQGIIDSIVIWEGETMTLEFSYPLNFPEGFRLERISSGEAYSLIVAYNSQSGEITSKHTGRGAMDFIIEP